ncbi:MAG: TraF peptidase [Proteobacteria bacterium]|nr:TraF peptidase [Pseudomonadota bacterium]
MKIVAVVAIILFTAAGAAGLAGARVNTTASMPQGLYWVQSQKPDKGSLVLFCPPNSQIFREAQARGYFGAGFCSSRSEALLKRIVAVEGDQVTISDQGIVVNGQRLTHSAPLKTDPAGRPLPAFTAERTLAAGQVLLMADRHPRSFDGRYFGPVDERLLKAVVVPVWTLSR